ncbi:hypothetical protein M378DRAFT_179977 [Amanita muscaria Koide BX008]|uniref:MICOS complex subunit n=1 Tax=Amanita muscaria (strain Koide BX008) TaxID=946122 RepID=A0A0C2WZ03_AMAMK|nr:hypothetical protein M378DRAFT_179977 [Amanita muscaria Koide BX008]
MFRALFRGVKARTIPPTSFALGAMSLSLSPDDSSSEFKPLATQPKLSIYPSPTPDIVLLDTPSRLERQISKVRKNILNTVQESRNEVQSVVDKWIGVEHAVESRVKAIISPSEQLTPNVLYIGISTLTGSIIARNRSLLGARLFLPSAFFLFSLHHFLPETTENLKTYLGEVEERYLPHVAQKHAVANAHTRMLVDRIKEETKEGRERFRKGVEWGVYKVQEVTGLKVGEVWKK